MPWAGSVAPVYPQYGSGGLYSSSRFPDFRTGTGDHQSAPARAPRGTAPAAPMAAGPRTMVGVPPADVRSRATLLAPPGFYRPYYTAANDPLLVQYGAGVRPFVPLANPPRFPW